MNDSVKINEQLLYNDVVYFFAFSNIYNQDTHINQLKKIINKMSNIDIINVIEK